MKYNQLITVPQNLREQLNEAALKQATLKLTGEDKIMSKKQLFSTFTGKGAISGVSLQDHDSFSDFIKTKRTEEIGQFFTSQKAVNTIVEILNVENHATVFDPTCGHGAFANAVTESKFHGVEIDSNVSLIASYLFPKANILNQNLIDFNQTKKFDYLISNPPFNIKIGKTISQNYILEKSVQWLKPYGFFAFIVPEKYLLDDLYFSKQIKFINENLNFLGAYKMINAFRNYNLKYPVKVLFFQNCKGREFDSSYMSSSYESFLDIKNEIIELKLSRKKHIVSTLSEDLKENDYSFKLGTAKKELGFAFSIKKMLYEIKVHCDQTKYDKAIGLLNDLKDQKQPPSISTEEWLKIRLTKKKVLHRISLLLGSKKRRKGERFNLPIHPNQLTPINELIIDKKITDFVNDFNCFNHKNKEISLFDYQKEDGSKILSKPFSLLGHEQGLGKTISSYMWSKFTERKTVIIFPAVVRKSWKQFLRANNESFIEVNNFSDIKKDVNYYLFSIEGLARKTNSKRSDRKAMMKKIKGYMKTFEYEIIVDECEKINNVNSNSYKAICSYFMSAKRKLAMSGTAIRNNPAEYYGLLNFLYNGTIKNECETWFIEQKVKGEPIKIVEKPNPKKGLKIGGYHGYGDFKKCFCPSKQSVFGIAKQNQDIFNEDKLIKLLNTVLIIRKFKDVNHDLYKINHVLINPSYEERILHEDILKETHSFINAYYGSTGNSRKDAGLKIMRQINLLIETTLLPQMFQEYSGEENTKILKCANIVNEHPNEIIAIGCTRIPVANYYYNFFKRNYEGKREVFLYTGTLSESKKTAILSAYEKSENGILICTQQSLSAGINMPYVNIAIVQGLRWNMPSISQWFFRFIRIDQQNKTDVYFVNYIDTIESNIFALINAKENVINITEQRKDGSLIEMGFDENLLSKLLSYSKNEDGKINVGWGK